MNPRTASAWLGLCVGIGLWAGCAELATVSSITPQVTFERLESVSIQPEGIRLEAVLSIKSPMRVPLPLQAMDYRLDINQQLFVKGTFDRFQDFAARGQQEVTLPFLVPWTVLTRVPKGQTGSDYHLALRGSVQVGGDYAVARIPFEMTKVLPVPVWPEIGFAGTEGTFGQGTFTIKLKVKNPNTFPIDLNQCQAGMVLNNQTYDLAYVSNATHLEPGASRIVALNLDQALGKGVSMVFNALMNQRLDFRVKGKTEFGTPFGTLRYAFDQPGKSR